MPALAHKALRPLPQNAIDLFSNLQTAFSSLDAELRAQLLSFEPEIREMASHCIVNSGKKLRPTLVFSSGWSGADAVKPELIRAAAVIEMVHLATLVHDDIMDHAASRRQKPTAAHLWGPSAAVLLGDALFAQAVHLSTQFDTNEVCREVSLAARRVCTGEIVQTLHRGQGSLSLDTYWRIVDLKTAELFRVSCYLGSFLSTGNRDAALSAADFGRHLGIAYQVFDDLADYLGDESIIGKTLGTDYLTGKRTLPFFLLEDLARDKKLALDLTNRTPEGLQTLREVMRKEGIGNAVSGYIDRELSQAEAALHQTPHPSAPVLALLADYLRDQVRALA